jgi:hypothetical protein
MRKITIFIFVLVLQFQVFGQYENTTYYLNRLPQSSNANPASNPECSFYIGGILIPFAGQILPPMGIQLNTPLSISDLVYPGDGFMADSLVTPWHPTQADYIDRFYKKIKKRNYFTQEFDLDILNVGFRIKRNFFTLQLTEKERMQFVLPGDFFSLITRGNGAVRDANFSGLGIDFSYYHQLALGYNREFGKSLKVGVKAKVLFGVLNLSMSQSEMYVKTANITNEIDVDVNYNVNTNIPLENLSELNNKGFNEAFDDVKLKDVDVSDPSQLKKYLLFTDNRGFAIDLGVHYKINDDYSVHASIVDLGYIKWTDESSNFNLQANYNFSGLVLDGRSLESLSDIGNGEGGSFSLDSIIKGVGDSTKVEALNGSYTTRLEPRLFFGGQYHLSSKTSLGLLARLDVRDKTWGQAYTASINWKIFRYGVLGLSYSGINGRYNNFGLAYTLRIGAWQMYMASDNMSAALFPMFARHVSLRFGTNLIFGRGAKTKRIPKNLPMFKTI